MKKLYWLLLGVPLLIGAASYSIAQPGGGQRGGGQSMEGRQNFAFWKVEKIVEKLSITPDQVRQLEDIHYTFQTDSVDPEARLKKSRLELDHLLSQATYSDENIGGLVDEISASSSERIKLGLNKQIAIRKILTTDQWSQLQQMRENQGRKMRLGKKRSGGSGGGGRGHSGEGRGRGGQDQDEGEDE